MGRTLKRVPLTFDWPLNKVWGGYINPYYSQATKCPACDGSGYAPEARRMHGEWYGTEPFDPVKYGATPLTVDHPNIVAMAKWNVERSPDYYGTAPQAPAREARRLFDFMRGQWCHHLIQADVDALVEADRLHDFCRRPRTEEQAAQLAKDGGAWMRERNGYIPTPDEVNAWSIGGMGHDSISASVCVESRCKRNGSATTCPRCNGEGEQWPSDKTKADAETWVTEEPPTGEGFQLWETTSEGSPSSPVFATLDELCAWCETGATTFGTTCRATAAEWRTMLNADFVVHREGSNLFL